MLFHVGGDFPDFFAFIAYHNHHSLTVVNQQTYFYFHKGLLPMFGHTDFLEIDKPPLNIGID
jgi:hypothetical protein